MVCLENVLKISLQEVLKMSWWHTAKTNILVLTKTSWRRLLKTKTKDVFKTSSRRLHQDECLLGKLFISNVLKKLEKSVWRNAAWTLPVPGYVEKSLKCQWRFDSLFMPRRPDSHMGSHISSTEKQLKYSKRLCSPD